MRVRVTVTGTVELNPEHYYPEEDMIEVEQAALNNDPAEYLQDLDNLEVTMEEIKNEA